MNLVFPELRGGPVQGLNDAGVENFQGAIDSYLARECAQNSLDAPRPGVPKVFLTFERLMLKPDQIPSFTGVQKTMKSCLERWGDKPKEREFFEQAVHLASQPEIPVLRISDYGTTGLTGDDSDEKGRWFALVKSQGVSNKGDTAGGSFGIGKSSPFAASRFRTVFYGTRTEAGSVSLQGVSRLVTHKNPDGKPTQGVGFIGIHDINGGEGGDPVFRAVRDEKNIPELFRRKEPGTDIWVVGYRSGKDWGVDLIRSIISNFWPAIEFGLIEFTVGGKSITRDNLAALIEQHASQEDFEAHHFYKSVANQPIKKSLKHVGACSLYLSSVSPDLPKKICMVRNSGMRIFDYLPRACRVPFSGLFICSDANGNKLLRKMEPPRHDTWDPKRIEDTSGKSALDEIKLWIREEVKKLNPLFSGDSFNENELAKYLADPDPENLPSEDTGDSKEEDLVPHIKPEPVPVTPIKTRPITVTAGENPGKDTGPNGGPLGDKNQGNAGNGKGENANGSTGGVEDPKPPAIRVRSYKSGLNDSYELVLRAESDYRGPVHILAVGENGLPEPILVKEAVLAGKKLPVEKNSITDISVLSAIPTRIAVKLATAERRSLTASF